MKNKLLLTLTMLILVMPAVMADLSTEVELCYDFEENTSATTLTDEGPNSLNATLITGGITQLTGAACPTGSCAFVSGDRYDINGSINNLNTGNGITISYFMNTTDKDAHQNIIRNDGTDYIRLIFNEINSFMYNGSSSSSNSIASGQYNSNTWYHIVTTWDGGLVDTYINGVGPVGERGAASNNDIFDVTLDQITFFDDTAGANQYAGAIDTLVIWNKTLSGADIAELYNGGVARSCDYITTPTTCTPDWSCDGYATASCLINDTTTAACNSVIDNNACGENYTGDYSEFVNQTGVCDYCTPSFSCDGYGAASCLIDDTSTASCNSTNDSNSCYATTSLPSDQYSGDYSEFINQTGACDYCTPDFYCAVYEVCQANSTQACTGTGDNNACYNTTGLPADQYTGTPSFPAQSCLYIATPLEKASNATNILVAILPILFIGLLVLAFTGSSETSLIRKIISGAIIAMIALVLIVFL